MSYSETFFENDHIPLPAIRISELQKFESEGLLLTDYKLSYFNFSLLQNPFRKFPYFTATNIDGALFKKIKRDNLFRGRGDQWKKDDRIPKQHQLGHELYKAPRSNFDKGHLTKREDVQWGSDLTKAVMAAESTYYFTNAIPQVDRLNRGIWRRIEDYILHHEVVKHHLKITLFTGPVFLEGDPDFVTKVRNEVIKLPYLFWKIVYYLKEGELHRTGFLTSQKTLLEKRRIVKPPVRGGDRRVSEAFMAFKDAKTYQVQVDFISEISGLQFATAKENFVDDSPRELILSGVDVRSEAALEGDKAHINLIL